MATTPNSIITPQAVGNGIATLTSPTAITARSNISGTSGLTSLKSTTTNGTKIYEIKVKSKGTSSAGSLFIWRYDGVNSYLEDEILISAITPSTTLDSWSTKKAYDNFALKSTESLWVSVSVQQDLTVFAQCSDL